MHPQNPYTNRYDLNYLVKSHPDLGQHLSVAPTGEDTIDFSQSEAVYALNKAILLADFKLTDYHLPTGYLIPPIPGRLDYLLHLKTFLSDQFDLSSSRLKGLDIGTGANAVYCILGAQQFNYSMVGTECDAKAVDIVKANIQRTKDLKNKIEVRHQTNKGFLFKNSIKSGEHFDFTLCNPPFHSSKEDAFKGSFKKLKNLNPDVDKSDYTLNFEGQANELWCNGGEALFIKRLIKESILFKDQVTLFSSLLSKASHLPKLKKQLTKAKAHYEIIPMEQGHKKSRILAWWYS